MSIIGAGGEKKSTKKFRISMEAKKDEIELEVQGKCNPCIDDGGMFEGFCAQCGVSFG
jgi:hypothetical protein